jgi:hypothetical protein
LHCETAITGVSGGPYGKKMTSATRVKKAEKASRLFYFKEKKMRKIKKKHNFFHLFGI